MTAPSLVPGSTSKHPQSQSLTSFLKTPLHTSFGGGSALWWPCNAPIRPKVFILFIPGNPGLSSFYIPYLSSIYHSPELKDQVEILAISHRGHAPVPATGASFSSHHGFKETQKDLVDEQDTSLAGQIRHKIKAVEAIRTVYPKTNDKDEEDVKLVVIGHSVGAYIGLHALQRTQEQIDGLQLLFPTVMHIANAPKARTLPLLLATNPIVQRFVLPLPLFLLSLLPAFVLLSLLRFVTGMPVGGLETTLEFLLTPGAPLNAARMARQEFDEIKAMTPEISRAVKSLRARNGSVRSYWSKGEQDSWAPEGHRRDLESALLLTRVDLPPHLNASPSDISQLTKPRSLRSRTLAMGGTITRAAGRRLVGRSRKSNPAVSSNGSQSPHPSTPTRPGIVPSSPENSRASSGPGSGTLTHRRTPRRRPSVSLATAKRSFDGTITLELPQGQDWGFLDEAGSSTENGNGADELQGEEDIEEVEEEEGEGDVFGNGGAIPPPGGGGQSPQQPQQRSPTQARTDLARQKTRRGEVTSTVCQRGMPHVFCLKYGQEMGVISAWWIANDFL